MQRNSVYCLKILVDDFKMLYIDIESSVIQSGQDA